VLALVDEIPIPPPPIKVPARLGSVVPTPNLEIPSLRVKVPATSLLSAPEFPMLMCTFP
jgi:hypothetical protein